MKLFSNIQIQSPRRIVSGFTIVEMMIAVAVFSLVILATVSMQIFGLRIYTLAATKLSATASARKTLNDIRDQIRSARKVDVGDYTLSSGAATNFSLIADGLPEQGNAVRIYSTTNYSSTAPYTLIFLQPGDGVADFTTTSTNGSFINTNSLILQTYSNGTMTADNTIATYITNQIVFQAQDFQNPPNVLTNDQDNRIIQIQLYFSQWEYPIASVGGKEYNAYDYYRVQTRVTRRAVD